MAELSDTVRNVKGIGPKKAALLERMGICTLQDALEFYPRDYEDRTRIVPIRQLVPGEKACICAVVGTVPQISHIRKGMELAKLRVFDESGVLPIVYFNSPYAAAQLREGETYLFYGRIQLSGTALQMASPEHEKYAGGIAHGRIVPVYALSAGITRRDVERVTDAALLALGREFPDPLPEPIRRKYALLPLADSLRQIHRPQNMDEAETARRRLIFEELFLLCCGLAQLKAQRRKGQGIPLVSTDLSAFWRQLAFAPTSAQVRATEEIVQDIAHGHPMNRLVQGDVGSGKTVVAAALCALAIQNGYQAAVMAPTEILAAQHYETFSRIFAPMGITVELLSGSLPAAQKREIKARIAAGVVQLTIGTHALIQQDVSFLSLGAIVVDEQHRFGVEQRARLSAKGDGPHVLVMSATPIPRTLALIVYGELDVSVLDELPPGRSPVETYAVGEKMRARIYKFMEKQCADGGQVYVVCPLVQEGETGLKSAEEHAKELEEKFPGRKVGLIHGKMRQADKDEVMRRFVAGEVDILVATTVIEVGVNVPNATLMVVEDAQRFGLSQLHQLRGRVGRGKRQSYCIFFGADKGENARARLQLLCRTTDGFAIAQADLEQRGPGDFFGSRQHGLPQLRTADLVRDPVLLRDAQQEAQLFLQQTPDLTDAPILRAGVEKLFRTTQNGGIFN